MEEPLYVSSVRSMVTGIRILSYPPNQQRDVQKLRELIQDLLRHIADNKGLAIGTEHYEELVNDNKLNTGPLEKEAVLNTNQTRLFRRIEALLTKLKADRNVQFSPE